MNSTEEKVLNIPIEDIIPNRFQPRLSFDENALQDLANSIKQHGIIQPLVLRRVNDKYEIIAGERRYKAAKMAGLSYVPAIITAMDDNTSAEVAIVENVQRKDLTAIEEAKSYKALLDKGYMTQEDLAKRMGLSQAAISNKLRLLTLDETVQQAVLEEKISERHARTLLKLKNSDDQKTMLDRIIKERLTVRQLDNEIKKMLENENPVINEEEITPVSVNTNVNEGEKMFGNPETVPNKFFNFLEDEAANMNMVDNSNTELLEPIENTPVSPKDMLQQTSDIEMLDDFSIEPNKTKDNEYLNEVITSIRNLHLDNDKVVIEEKNLPTEYIINIKIQKDKIN